MSNAMRSGKRLLAGVAAGALGAGVLVGLGTTSAQAAPGDGVVTAIAQPAAYRATLPENTQNILLTGSGFGSAGAAALILCQVAAPTGGAYTPSTTNAQAPLSATNAVLNVGVFTVPGAYTLAVREAVAVGDNCATAGGVTIREFNVTVGGPIATFTATPAQQSVPLLSAATYTMTFTDAAGRPTLPVAADYVTALTDTAPPTGTVTYAPNASGRINQANIVAADTTATGAQRGSTVRFTATGSIAGFYNMELDPLNASNPSVFVSMTVIAQGQTTAVSTIAAATNSNLVQTPASTPAATTYVGSLNLNTLSWNVSGLQPGLGYTATVSGTNSNKWTVTGNQFVSSATGGATITAVRTGAALAAGDGIILTIAANGGPAPNTATIAFQASAWTLTTNPANGGTSFAAASGTVPVTATVEDQFGIPSAGATVTITTGGAAVATATTGANGVATLSVTAPASGSRTFTVVAAPLAGAAPAPSTFTVSVSSPTVAIIGGVDDTVTGPVIIATPANDAILTAGAGVDTTRLTLRVTDASGAQIPNAVVTVTGSEGVRFMEVAPAGQPWNFGSSTAVTDTVNNLNTTGLWAYSTKAGVNTITVSVAGGATPGRGTFTAQSLGFFLTPTPTGAERNVAIQAPAMLASGDSGLVSVIITDNFGNPVTGGLVNLAMAPTSVGRFGNGNRQIGLQADANGIAQTVVLTSANEAGDLIFTTAGNANASEQYQAVANQLTPLSAANSAIGFTASDAPKTTTIKIEAAGDRSITIVGSRTTVSGKSGIRVEGTVEGIENGKTVTPFIRFPGQTTFEAGSARPTVTDGDVTWQRKTGKRVTVYLQLTDDAAVKSNRVTIQAS